MADPDAETTTPSFLTIPIELRNEIYSYCLEYAGSIQRRNPIFLDHRCFWPKHALMRNTEAWPNVPKVAVHTSIFLVNRQVNEEVKRIFWPLFRFGFFDIADAHSFVGRVPEHLRAQVRHLALGLTPRPQRRPWWYDPSEWRVDETNKRSVDTVLPLIWEICDRLPQLESVAFDVANWRWPGTELFLRDVGGFERQMEPFRHVQQVWVRHRDDLDPRYLVESPFMEVAGGLAKAGWLRNAGDAMEVAYNSSVERDRPLRPHSAVPAVGYPFTWFGGFYGPSPSRTKDDTLYP